MSVCICVLCGYVYCARVINFIIMVLLGTTCLLHPSFQKKNSINTSIAGLGNLQASVSEACPLKHRSKLAEAREPHPPAPVAAQAWCRCGSDTGGLFLRVSSVQSLSRVRLLATPWAAAHQTSLSITNSQSLLKLMCIESVMPSNQLILCHPLLLPPSIFPSTRVFSNESVLWMRWPKYWSFSFNISPSNESSGLISFRMDWLDLLAVQGTLKSLLQHHSSKASILWHSAFFMVQL